VKLFILFILSINVESKIQRAGFARLRLAADGLRCVNTLPISIISIHPPISFLTPVWLRPCRAVYAYATSAFAASTAGRQYATDSFKSDTTE